MALLLFWIIILILPIIIGVFFQRAIVKKNFSKGKKLIYSTINLAVIALVLPIIEIFLYIYTSNSDPAASGWLLVFYVIFSPVILGVIALVLYIADRVFQKRLAQ